ncbi:branched-chain amino acid ABC transporter permease [Caldinitratiruptor microaerophilus]|uniref:Branched-chain amino acid ABC transporter permease n=1 Tax=Caldinitratiruptor microaerophilus TaxID=671077 RepID=A0AA35CIK5_9FIRM|nr:branched-chain amino acid ABC transporter permease [Caldinitratiruptor microaerophilus]BDG59835.1 branched-chain amino acid ABC transporter permease [Caldinitratiruptor microaerophilus]
MDLTLQLLWTGLALGGIYSMLAMGFTLIYGTTRQFHVAHGGIFTVAGYVGYIVAERLALGLVPALVVAVMAAGLGGLAVYEGVYRPLVRRGATPLVVFIASLGLLYTLDNLCALLFGQDPLVVETDLKVPWSLGSVSVTPLQVVTVAVGLAVFGAAEAILRWTSAGKALRGVADSPEMAQIVGVDVRKAYRLAYVMGSAIAAPAALLIAADAGITPFRGSLLVLLSAVIMIMGGLGSLPGALLAGFSVALAESLSVSVVSAEWSAALVFTVFMVFIVVRPTGFFGDKVTSAKL